MKPSFIISCPVDTYSGYGARSRDLVKAIIELDKFDLKILPQRWGNTPWGFIEDHPEWEFLNEYLLPPGNNLPFKPKFWAQVTIPNEFHPVGDYNIGFTAGIETTAPHHTWIQGMNRMDLNIVSSTFAKEVLESTSYTQRDHSGNPQGELKLEKPVEVLFEGADLNKYFPAKNSTFDLSQIKESFAFLAMGHWMQGDIGEDRKNIGLTIKLFYETFKNRPNPPALILKTSGAGASYMDRDGILQKLHAIKSSIKADTLPNIYFLHGELTDKEINDLYNHKKVKALISLTKGEGFGRPLLEFTLTKKPVVTTNWSGHLDFLDSKFTTLLNGEVKQLHPSSVVKDMIVEDGKWFSPDVNEASFHLNNLYTNYKSYEKGAMLQYHRSKNSFNFDKMVESLSDIATNNFPTFPDTVELHLPKLKLPKLQTT